MYEIPDEWLEMSDAEQDAWVEAALVKLFEDDRRRRDQTD